VLCLRGHDEGDGEGAIRVHRRGGEQLLIVPGDRHWGAGSPPTALSRHDRAVRPKGRGERHRHARVTGWRWWWSRRWCRCRDRRWWRRRRGSDLEERRLQPRDTPRAGLRKENLVITRWRVDRDSKGHGEATTNINRR